MTCKDHTMIFFNSFDKNISFIYIYEFDKMKNSELKSLERSS